jgi:hypothetical protein
MKRLTLLLGLLLATSAPSRGASGAGPAHRLQTLRFDDEADIRSAIEQFLRAEREYDRASLEKLTAAAYVEVSPLGETDPRDRFLGFYDAAQKQDAPTMRIAYEHVNIFGTTAAVLVTLSYDFAGRSRQVRASYVLHRYTSGWKFVAAQFTGVQTKAP